MVHDVPLSIMTILYRTVFSNIQDVTEQNMASVLFGMYKDVYVTERAFYEPTSSKNFWVHKMDEDNLFFNQLVSSQISFHVITFFM